MNHIPWIIADCTILGKLFWRRKSIVTEGLPRSYWTSRVERTGAWDGRKNASLYPAIVLRERYYGTYFRLINGDVYLLRDSCIIRLNPDKAGGQWAIDVQDNYELLKRYSHGHIREETSCAHRSKMRCYIRNTYYTDYIKIKI